MAFNFPAVTYIIALIADAFLIFFSIFHVIAFDELKTDYKNPIDQCNSLNPVSEFRNGSKWIIIYFIKFENQRLSQCMNFLLIWSRQLVIPEYLLHLVFNILFLFAGEWFSLLLNIPLIAYHVFRYKNRPVMSGPGLYDPTSIMNAGRFFHVKL